jgi:hypothetical protein
VQVFGSTVSDSGRRAGALVFEDALCRVCFPGMVSQGTRHSVLGAGVWLCLIAIRNKVMEFEVASEFGAYRKTVPWQVQRGR